MLGRKCSFNTYVHNVRLNWVNRESRDLRWRGGCLFTFVGASRGHLGDSTAFLLNTNTAECITYFNDRRKIGALRSEVSTKLICRSWTWKRLFRRRTPWRTGRTTSSRETASPTRTAAGAYALRVHYWVCTCCCHGAAIQLLLSSLLMLS